MARGDAWNTSLDNESKRLRIVAGDGGRALNDRFRVGSAGHAVEGAALLQFLFRRTGSNHYTVRTVPKVLESSSNPALKGLVVGCLRDDSDPQSKELRCPALRKRSEADCLRPKQIRLF
ncbi:MAG TPA: hypothetical protein VH042_02380 [Solirubrobacterales bacterium]|jgi:hypothetical protein|nr:hypothetical protein [Solirubrobacterales bacterium]